MSPLRAPLPDHPDVARLFEPVEERARLQKSLGIQPEQARARLLDEYTRLKRDQVDHITRPSGLHMAYLKHAQWLSERLHRPVFQLRHLLGEEVEGRLEVLESALKRLKKEASGALIIARAPAQSVALSQGLSSLGFGWVGVEMTGVIKLDERPPQPVEATAQGLSLGALTPDLLDQAQEIAGEAHTYNHFECDPLISTLEARRLFQEQVALHLKSARSQGFGAVGEGHEGLEALFGFIIANRVESFLPFGGPLLANLDFVCVNPLYQLRGLGHALNLTALGWLYDQGVRRLSVRTMVNNYAAQRILGRVGWRPQLAEGVFHAHL
jgi:GNAT superfamily N-acetyltransferase